jgi:transposase
MERHGLNDREWSRLEPLLPPKSHIGRPPKDHRTIIDALLWLGRTGAPWRDLPERYGPWRTVATRFYRWTRSGLWERLLAELRRIADAKGGIDWEVHLVDGTSVRAHRCAAGGKGGGSARRWAATAGGSAASCTCAATGGAGRWRSC